jgi:hypothetical protein
MEKREEEVEEEESKFVVSSESEINGQGEEGEENHVESQSLTANESPVVSETTTAVNEVVVANNNQSSNAETLIRTQLKQNLKDRLFMLNVEKSLVEFINNDK